MSDLVADQVGRGWHITVASPEGPLADRVRAAGAGQVVWSAGRAPGPQSLFEAIQLGRIVRQVDPELVHLHSSKAGLAGRLAIRGRRPTLFQPHAWSFYALEGSMRSAATAWERFGARWATTIVCVSEGERADGEAAGIRGSWRVVHNGVDLKEFAVEERESARMRLGLAAGRLAVSIGRLSRQKGFDLLLQAWPGVRERVEAELVVVGSGPDEEHLRARAGSARLVGARDDIASWLAAADVVVIPSRWEGLAYVALEAMAAGRRVVATDVAGMREALGGTGTIVPPEDPEALAVALAEALSWSSDGSGARERAEQLYDVRRSTQAMADLYAEVLGRSSQ